MPCEFSFQDGFMPSGNDLHSGQMTIGDAKAWCESRFDCCGFTFQGEYSGDDNMVAHVMFKSDPTWAPGGGWKTFLAVHAALPPAPAPAPVPDSAAAAPGWLFAESQPDITKTPAPVETRKEADEIPTHSAEQIAQDEELARALASLSQNSDEEQERWILGMTPKELDLHNLRKAQLKDVIANNQQKRSWNLFEKKIKPENIDSLLFEYRGNEFKLFETLEKKFGVDFGALKKGPPQDPASMSVSEIKALLNGYGVEPRRQLGLEKRELVELLQLEMSKAALPNNAGASAAAPAELSGMRVVVHGLKSKPELNGEFATAGDFNNETKRYHVTIESTGAVLALKVDNLLTLKAQPQTQPQASQPAAPLFGGTAAVFEEAAAAPLFGEAAAAPLFGETETAAAHLNAENIFGS
jgi:hypothetical protein